MSNRERAQKVLAILKENLADPPGLEELGRRVGCSHFYLSRIFTQEAGKTISVALRDLRMERAASLLREGRMNVTQAALEVGYSSLSHFSAAFHEVIGCCPGLYPLARTPKKNLTQAAAKESQSTESGRGRLVPCSGHENERRHFGEHFLANVCQNTVSASAVPSLLWQDEDRITLRRTSEGFAAERGGLHPDRVVGCHGHHCRSWPPCSCPCSPGPKKQARRANCASNLRQWGMALNMYLDDSSQVLPAAKITNGTPGELRGLQ